MAMWSGREQRQPEVMIEKELPQAEDASLKARWLGNRALESSVDFKSCRVDRLGPESKTEAAEESALVKDKKTPKFEDQRK